MTRIIYPYNWQNVGENQLSYTLLCKTGVEPWKLTILILSGNYRTIKGVIHGMTKGLYNRFRDIYLKSDREIHNAIQNYEKNKTKQKLGEYKHTNKKKEKKKLSSQLKVSRNQRYK